MSASAIWASIILTVPAVLIALLGVDTLIGFIYAAIAGWFALALGAEVQRRWRARGRD